MIDSSLQLTSRESGAYDKSHNAIALRGLWSRVWLTKRTSSLYLYIIDQEPASCADGGRRANVANKFTAKIVTAAISVIAETGSHDHAHPAKP